MNAVEIIEQIKDLPPEEVAQVVNFVDHLKTEQKQPVNYMDSATVQKTADSMFKKHADLFEKLAQ